MSASLSLAFIGTGVMGRSMAGHLQKAGHTLHVYNRTKEKAAALLEAGFSGGKLSRQRRARQSLPRRAGP